MAPCEARKRIEAFLALLFRRSFNKEPQTHVFIRSPCDISVGSVISTVEMSQRASCSRFRIS